MIARSFVVVPDVSPLIHLAAAGALDLLHAFGTVVVTDVVAFEASGDPAKPWAREIAEWVGGRKPVRIATTEIGEAYALARRADPRFRLRNAGENAIRDWLVEALPDLGGPALVVYEDRRVPNLIARAELGEKVVLATTRTLLIFAQERGLIVSAEELWRAILTRAPSANPML
jgi:hypothetical protein